MARVLFFLCVAVLGLPQGGAGATEAHRPVALRQHVVLHEQVVTLGHLFANLPSGLEAATVGPAPLPGQRWVLEARQLSLIARDNRLTWRPTSPDERLVIERPGRRISREMVEDALAAELGMLGLPAGLEPERRNSIRRSSPKCRESPAFFSKGRASIWQHGASSRPW